jgi:hypothetical protein
MEKDFGCAVESPLLKNVRNWWTWHANPLRAPSVQYLATKRTPAPNQIASRKPHVHLRIRSKPSLSPAERKQEQEHQHKQMSFTTLKQTVPLFFPAF